MSTTIFGRICPRPLSARPSLFQLTNANFRFSRYILHLASELCHGINPIHEHECYSFQANEKVATHITCTALLSTVEYLTDSPVVSVSVSVYLCLRLLCAATSELIAHFVAPFLRRHIVYSLWLCTYAFWFKMDNSASAQQLLGKRKS